MNIKSLLLGSAAALAVVSGAQAADAIVAAEPEPMEYVRVCDAFGTGYFYIPGTETCLKIGGYVRTQLDFRGDDYEADTVAGNDSGFRTNSRAYLEVTAKNDSELGEIESYVALEADSRSDDGFMFIDTAVIKFAGLTVGYFYNYWDTGINGETDDLGSNLNDAIQYTYATDAFNVSAMVENLDTADGEYTDEDSVGISGQVGATFGVASIEVVGSYDFGAEESAYRAIFSADVGPGTLQVAGIYATGANEYWDDSEWAVAASYKAKITDKLSLTPGFQYWGNREFSDSDDAWKAGLTVDYKIAEGLTTKISAQYENDDLDGSEGFGGFFRLQRSF
jgi:Porin subfamily